MKKRPELRWTPKEDSILKKCCSMRTPFATIVKLLKKEGFIRTEAATSHRAYFLRKTGVIPPKKKMRTGAKTGRMSSGSMTTPTVKTEKVIMPVLTTGMVTIKHKMFTMTTTDNSITIEVNSKR